MRVARSLWTARIGVYPLSPRVASVLRTLPDYLEPRHPPPHCQSLVCCCRDAACPCTRTACACGCGLGPAALAPGTRPCAPLCTGSIKKLYICLLEVWWHFASPRGRARGRQPTPESIGGGGRLAGRPTRAPRTSLMWVGGSSLSCPSQAKHSHQRLVGVSRRLPDTHTLSPSTRVDCASRAVTVRDTIQHHRHHTTLHNTTQHNTTQHNTTQHSTTQHNTTQHNTTQHNTTQHNTTQHNTTQHNTTQHNTTQHNTTQHNTTQHNTTQHNTTQHNTTLHNTTHHTTPQHNTTQHNTTQHNTTQHNTTQHNTTQHNTTQHNTTQHNTPQHNTTQHNTTQHNTTQHNTTQHNTTQHNTTQHNTPHHSTAPHRTPRHTHQPGPSAPPALTPARNPT